MNLTDLESKLSDPIWRLTSGELYKIAPADGTGLQPFKPRPEQVQVIEAVHVLGKQRILIPKARRLGMSTVIGIMMVDFAIWNEERQCSLVDQTQKDATIKLNRICKVAFENLPEWAKKAVSAPKSNDSELSIEMNGRSRSTIYAGMNARGGSNDVLWVSEWGVIQFEDPKRSQEIRSGALPTARHGITIVETTWAGGRGGDVWELLEPSLTGKADDWHVMFFPWYIDPRNVSDAQHDQASDAYFDKIAPRLVREEITLNDRQKRWWAQERRAQGIFMARENPTFLDECWSAPVKGAIYAEAIEQARAEGRIAVMPMDGSTLVHTSWDLGAPANTVVWYWQLVGREIRFIDVDIGDKGTIVQRVAYMIGRGLPLGKHFVPHDAEQTARNGLTLVQEMRNAGLQNIHTVPRTHSLWVGINHTLEMFPSFQFRSPQCDEALGILGCYRSKQEGEGALSVNEPVHDWSSHCADALRTMAEAHKSGQVAFKHTPAKQEPERYFGHGAKRKGAKPMRVFGC